MQVRLYSTHRNRQIDRYVRDVGAYRRLLKLVRVWKGAWTKTMLSSLYASSYAVEHIQTLIDIISVINKLLQIRDIHEGHFSVRLYSSTTAKRTAKMRQRPASEQVPPHGDLCWLV